MSYIRSGNPNFSSVSAGRVRCCSRCCRCARARVEAGSSLFFRVLRSRLLPLTRTASPSSTWARDRCSTPKLARRPEVGYFFIFPPSLLHLYSFRFFFFFFFFFWLILCLSVFVLVVPFPFHVSLHVHRPVSPLFRKEEPSIDIVIFLQVRKENNQENNNPPLS